MNNRRPAEVFPPGDYIREELDARGWTQTDLAEILGRPPRLVNELVAAKRGVSPETAKGLAAAFDTSPEFWLNLESAYQLSRVATTDETDAVRRRAKLYDLAPVKDMIRRGWIEASDSVSVLEGQVLQFFDIKTLDEEPNFFPFAARQSGPYGKPTPAQIAWLYRARQLARAVSVNPFSRERLVEAPHRLKPLLHVPMEARHVPRVLSEAGIRFVVVQPLPGTKIDGACFWLDGNSPVIALSLRYDRIDNFWFTLLHELGHVMKRDGWSLDTDLESAQRDSGRPEREQLADKFASEHLIAAMEIEDFIARIRPLYSTRRIEAFAQRLQVHPGIVVGQLQHRGEIVWANFRRMLVPVKEWIMSAAVTDGWGASLPADL